MSILSDEIINDPTGKGYVDLLPNQPGHVLDLLNAKTETKLGLLSRTDLTIWAASTGMRATIEDLSLDKESPLRSSALAILDVLKGSSSGIDLSKPWNMAILNAWEAASVLTTVNKDNMIALAMQPASRLEILGLQSITEEMIRDI